MSRRSPGTIGAATGADDRVAAPGIPAESAAGTVHTGGASLGFGTALLSRVWGIFATPVGRPDVVGVGAWALDMEAPAPRSATIASRKRAGDGWMDSSNSAQPPAIHKPAKRVMAIYSGRFGAAGLAGGRASSTTQISAPREVAAIPASSILSCMRT